jgi:uncharacterized protein (TIGR02271 family)
MSLVVLSQQDEYGLMHSEQDCRGWAVVDAAGKTLGTCTDMIVDTEAEHIDSIVLDTGAKIPASQITLQRGTVLVRAGGEATVAKSTSSAPPKTATPGSHDDITLPVIEERIKVGKREVRSGGVRITQRVTDRPVEEAVTLRDERVSVERRPVNQPAVTVGADAFKEGVIEITETDEEAVVTKQGRVVEEVVVSKDVTERREVVRDTVKRTDVEVQQLDGTTPRESSGAVDATKKGG